MRLHRSFLLVIFLVFSVMAYSQKTKKKLSKSEAETVAIKEKKKLAEAEKAKLPKPYHPKDNAEQKILELVKIAQQENKNIILQAGGNWCIWCLRFNDFVQKTPELKKIIDENYLYYHLNFSPENKNEKIFAKYGNPGDHFGYPVLLVLDKNGKLIHTQETGQLEQDKGYSVEKVKEFFNNWISKN